MKHLPFLLLLLLSQPLAAQSVERAVIGAYGASGTAGTIQLDMTVGEIATTTANAGSLIITQGFHQPAGGSVGIEDELGVQVDYRLYPNPTTDMITLEMTGAKPVAIRVEIVDARGRLTGLEQRQLQVGSAMVESSWDTSTLAEGMYLLVIRNQSNEIAGSIRFQKR
jgi:Secretion system C-terminal sorting domain